MRVGREEAEALLQAGGGSRPNAHSSGGASASDNNRSGSSGRDSNDDAAAHGAGGAAGDGSDAASAHGKLDWEEESDSLKPGSEDAAGAAGAGGGGGARGEPAAGPTVLACAVWEMLQRRSLGDAASKSPLLVQLGAQELAAATSGRLLRCLPMPPPPSRQRAPVAAAAAAAPALGTPLPPVVPHLTGLAPRCIVMPPEAERAAGGAPPAVLVLCGQGLWDPSGAPGLVLCRQQGTHQALMHTPVATCYSAALP